MQTNQAGIDLIKSFEGLRLTAYQDVRVSGPLVMARRGLGFTEG